MPRCWAWRKGERKLTKSMTSFFTKMFTMSRCATNRVAVLELRKIQWKGKRKSIAHVEVKYWLCLLVRT